MEHLGVLLNPIIPLGIKSNNPGDVEIFKLAR